MLQIQRILAEFLVYGRNANTLWRNELQKTPDDRLVLLMYINTYNLWGFFQIKFQAILLDSKMDAKENFITFSSLYLEDRKRYVPYTMGKITFCFVLLYAVHT